MSGFAVSEKGIIVIEVGSALTKCGFSKEGVPRHIVPTPLLQGQVITARAFCF
jgi:actin-related protein